MANGHHLVSLPTISITFPTMSIGRCSIVHHLPFLTRKLPARNIIDKHDKNHFHFLSNQSWCQYVIFTFLSKKKIAQETTPSVWIKILNNEIQIEDPAIFRFELWRQKTKKIHTNATYAITHPHMQAIWWDIWKHTVEKRRTNATSVTLHPLIQALWGHIWKHTVEKSQTNATNANTHPLRQVIWGDIWKHTVEKRRTNAIWVILHPLGNTI